MRSARDIYPWLLAGGLIVVNAGAVRAADGLDLGALLPAGGVSASGRIIQLFGALTVLSIAPGLLIMVTSFTRFAIALSFLRTGLGLQSTPANLVLLSLALFMTFFVMAPTMDEAWSSGVAPLMENKISEQEAFGRIAAPFRRFMSAHVREKDIRLFEELRPGAEAARSGAERRSNFPFWFPPS